MVIPREAAESESAFPESWVVDYELFERRKGDYDEHQEKQLFKTQQSFAENVDGECTFNDAGDDAEENELKDADVGFLFHGT